MRQLRGRTQRAITSVSTLPRPIYLQSAATTPPSAGAAGAAAVDIGAQNEPPKRESVIAKLPFVPITIVWKVRLLLICTCDRLSCVSAAGLQPWLTCVPMPGCLLSRRICGIEFISNPEGATQAAERGPRLTASAALK